MKEFSDNEYEIIWNKFEEKFKFTPSVDPKNWPGIVEPTPSFTIDFPLFGKVDYPNYSSLTAFFNNVFQKLRGDSQIRYMLDW